MSGERDYEVRLFTVWGQILKQSFAVRNPQSNGLFVAETGPDGIVYQSVFPLWAQGHGHAPPSTRET